MISKSLVHSLKVQLRVIWALVLREVITRYGRNNIGFLWLFVEPIIFTLVISILWNATRDAHGFKLPITAFAVTGYSSMLLWRNMITRCGGAISSNIGLLFHRNVKVLDVFASRIFLELIGNAVSFLALVIGFFSLGMMQLPVDTLKVIFGWVMLAWFGASLALVYGSLSERYEIVDKIWSPLRLILYPLSGLAFMVEWLPGPAREKILWLPMVHGLELLREGYFGEGVRAHYDMSYMAVFCLGLSFLGLSLTKILSRKVIPA